MDGIANQIVMESKVKAKLEGPDAERDLVSALVKANVSQCAGGQPLTQAELIVRKP
jgi:hypothetical protein